MGRPLLNAVVLVLVACPQAFALNPALDVSQYAHTSWKVRDGYFKGQITSIAQSSDGYLWLGTESGLLRFDGVRFVPWQPPPDQSLPSTVIARLLTARDGTLWIGTYRGLASWKDGRLTQYEALAGSYVGKLVEDREGSIWVTRFMNRWTLCRIQKGRVTCYGENGGPGADALGLYEDRTGNLWVGTASGLWRWSPAPQTFYPLPREENGIQGLSEDTDGSLLVSKADGIKRFMNGRVETAYPFPPSIQPPQALHLLRDRDGGLWAGTSTVGLVHVHEGISDVFSRIDGLSGDAILALFEDREGSIWVATIDGLDRFRETAVVSYSVNQGLSNGRVNSVLAASDGSVWVGTFDGLNRWDENHVTVYRERSALGTIASGPRSSRRVREVTGRDMPTGVEAIFEDSQRRVWLSTARGVGHLENDRFVSPKGIPGGLTRAIVEDSSGNLWIVKPDRGLFRMARGSQEVDRIDWAALNREDRATAVTADAAGEGLWLGFFGGGISHFAGGQVRASYDASNGLAGGRISALHADPDGTLWVAADGGLSRVKNGGVATLTTRNGLPCESVGWVIEDAAHALWLGMPCGLVRIARTQIDAWTAAVDKGDAGVDQPHRVQGTVFDQADGVRIFVNANYYTAPAARSADGKLWFLSQEGVSVVDPAQLPANPLAAPVHIEQVIADRKVYRTDAESIDTLRLPPLTRDLQIDYTALSLVAPEKMQFRYMLEGWDRDWQDVGTRRQAFYTDLSPGNYRFRVTASNNSGVWNETGASIAFAIVPAYYQTGWFLALSVGVALALVWTAYRVRVGVVERHQREITALNERLMKAQEQERMRIAGELHDGVMQEMLAVTMMLGTAKRRIADDAGAKATIDKVQDKMIRLGTDIRQLSHELHPPMLQTDGLPQAVRGYCEQFSGSSGIRVSCDADETVHDLSRGAALALFRVLQEALGNAAKHARATRITVHLKRSNALVSLVVSDDGRGFDRSQLSTAGGLGLITMRERAAQLNGTFEVESTLGRGTTIRVVIPFR